MPRNTLKSFPTGMLRRGLAHFHPGCGAGVQPPIDSPEPPGTQPEVIPVAPPQASGPAPLAPRLADVAEAVAIPAPRALRVTDVAEAVAFLPVA